MDRQKRLQELRAALSQAEGDMKAIFDTAEKENRSRTVEEKSKWDDLKKKADGLVSEIADLEEQIKRDAQAAKAAGEVRPTVFAAPGKSELGKEEMKNVRGAKISNYIRASNPKRYNDYKLEGVEAELDQDMRSADGFKTYNNLPGYDPNAPMIPPKVLRHLEWGAGSEKRDIQATGSGLGLELVNTDTLASNYVQALRNQNVLMNAGARVIQNDSGSNIVFPRESSLYTAAMASTENATASESMTSGAFITSPLTFSPKRGTGKVQVSNQALLQFGWWEPYLREQIILGNATLMDTQGINGSGSSGQARGILNTSNTQTVVGGTNGANFARTHITQFESGVGGAGAELNSCRFITNFAVNAYGKRAEFSSGSGRYLIDAAPSWAWANDATGKGAKSIIDQYPVFLSNNVPSNLTKGTSTTICSAVIFGDVTKMVYMNFGGMQLIVDPYVNADASLTNYVVHFWFDFNVILPGAVSFSADMLTP